MIRLKSYLKEQESGNHGVLAFGRMNPPTIGHEKLVDKVHDVVKQTGGSHKVVLSHSNDPKKNPLHVDDKVKHARRAFPSTNIVGSSKETPTIMHHASKMHDEGINHLHIVAGSDRHKEFGNLLNTYNGKEGKHGYYNFKSITMHSAGARDPDSEGAKGMSASKMRDHATSGNQDAFHQGLPSHMSSLHKAELYSDVRKSMGSGVNEEKKEEIKKKKKNDIEFKPQEEKVHAFQQSGDTQLIKNPAGAYTG